MMINFWKKNQKAMIHETKKLDQIGVNSFETVQKITWVINS